MYQFLNIIGMPLNYSLFSGSCKITGVVNHALDRRGSQFYAFNEDLHKAIFMGKIRRNLSNIHKIMTFCAKWHSQGVKGFNCYWKC